VFHYPNYYHYLHLYHHYHPPPPPRVCLQGVTWITKSEHGIWYGSCLTSDEASCTARTAMHDFSPLPPHIYTPNSLHIPYDLPFTPIKFINLTLLYSFAYEKIRVQKVRMQKVLDASGPGHFCGWTV
jgi:hypothetical protein